MSRAIHFAHLTDLHITSREKTWGTLGSVTSQLVEDTFAYLNQIADLDFALITGDVLDQANQPELDLFLKLLGKLEKPWHFVPGNHDGFIDPEHPGAFAPYEAIPLIDPRMASPRPDAQRAYWSRRLMPGIQLIGLDSRLPDHWGGVINPGQLSWLRDELEMHRGDLVIIAVHHPLHPLTARNSDEWWSNFHCANGAEVEALLDGYPDAKLVLAGHHHAHHVAQRGGRLHINTASLSGYPCEFRLVSVTEQADGWQVQGEMVTVADGGILKATHAMICESGTAGRFRPENPEAWADFVAGRDSDRRIDVRL